MQVDSTEMFATWCRIKRLFVLFVRLFNLVRSAMADSLIALAVRSSFLFPLRLFLIENAAKNGELYCTVNRTEVCSRRTPRATRDTPRSLPPVLPAVERRHP